MFVDFQKDGTRGQSGQAAQMKIEQTARKATAALAVGNRHRQNLRFVLDQSRHDEASQPRAGQGAVRNDVSVEQEAFDFLFAPAAPEGCTVQRCDGRCVARGSPPTLPARRARKGC